MFKKLINGVEKADVDKKWLYIVNFLNFVVFIDEVCIVWFVRGYVSWI